MIMSLFRQRAKDFSYGVLSVNIIIYESLEYVRMMYEDDELFQQLANQRSDIMIDRLYSHYDPHDTIMLFYDVGVNIFVDERGDIHHDIYRLLKPWQVFLFKNKKECMTFPDVTNTFLIELVYPDYMYLRHT